MNKLKRGFTLIELLIVITILGVLAVVVLVAINPLEQIARARDAGRVSTIAQLGHALSAYAVNNNGVFVPEAGCAAPNNTWIGCLVASQDISTTPANPNATAPVCAVNAVNGYCYDATAALGTAPMIIFSRLESTSTVSRCTTTFAGTNRAYAIYGSAVGQGGTVCMTNADPTVGVNGTAAKTSWLP